MSPKHSTTFVGDTDELICFCGWNGCNKDSLSWIICCNCGEPMHGQCAGFSDQEELMQQTWKIGSKSNLIRMCDEKRCPFCVTAKHALTSNLIQSRATLIVTPPSILSQWEREIKRHTFSGDVKDDRNPRPSLTVKTYHGVREICQSSHAQAKGGLQRRLLHANYLADADSKWFTCSIINLMICSLHFLNQETFLLQLFSQLSQH